MSILSDFIEGSDLNAVTFVMDYSQLQFSSARLDIFVWPKISVNDQLLTIESPTYEKELHNLIGQVVTSVVELNESFQGFQIHFGPGQTLIINPSYDEIVGPEIMLCRSTEDHQWMVWSDETRPFGPHD